MLVTLTHDVKRIRVCTRNGWLGQWPNNSPVYVECPLQEHFSSTDRMDPVVVCTIVRTI